MDQYTPPLVAVSTGIVLIFLCFYIRIPFFIIGILSIAFVIYGFQDHIIRFALDYKSFSAPAFFKENAPVLIITVVILLSLGFLLLKFGSKAVIMNQPTHMDYGRSLPGQAPQKPGFFNGLKQWFSRKPNPANRSYNSSMNRYGNSGRYMSDKYSLARRA